MKKLFLLTAIAVFICIISYAAPTEAVLKAFEKAFTKVENAQWSENSGNYVVNFSQNTITTKVTYDKDGNFVTSLRYYGENNLPMNVLLKLKKKHEGKTIFGVTEDATPQEVIYYIKVYDNNNWYTVRATSDAALETVEKYKKN